MKNPHALLPEQQFLVFFGRVPYSVGAQQAQWGNKSRERRYDVSHWRTIEVTELCLDWSGSLSAGIRLLMTSQRGEKINIRKWLKPLTITPLTHTEHKQIRIIIIWEWVLCTTLIGGEREKGRNVTECGLKIINCLKIERRLCWWDQHTVWSSVYCCSVHYKSIRREILWLRLLP